MVFSWLDVKLDNPNPGFTLAGTMVEDTFQPGFICLGAPIGSDEYVEATIAVKVEELREKVEALLGEDKQGLWTILQSSFAHKLEYCLAIVLSSQVKKAAREVDTSVHSVLEKVTGSHLPQQPGALTCPCCATVEGFNPGIPGLPTTFQHLTATLPLKLGGLGGATSL